MFETRVHHNLLLTLLPGSIACCTDLPAIKSIDVDHLKDAA
jgi:hypothetical protein